MCKRGQRKRERENGRKTCVCVCDSMSVVLCLRRVSVSSPEERSCWFNWSQPRPCRPCPHLSVSVCLSLSQNPFLTQPRYLPSVHFTHTYYKQDILLNPKSLSVICCFFVRSSLWITICTELAFVFKNKYLTKINPQMCVLINWRWLYCDTHTPTGVSDQDHCWNKNEITAVCCIFISMYP